MTSYPVPDVVNLVRYTEAVKKQHHPPRPISSNPDLVITIRHDPAASRRLREIVLAASGRARAVQASRAPSPEEKQ